VVRKDKQRGPAVTEADLAEILSNVKKRKYAVLFALLAGTGLRIGLSFELAHNGPQNAAAVEAKKVA